MNNSLQLFPDVMLCQARILISYYHKKNSYPVRSYRITAMLRNILKSNYGCNPKKVSLQVNPMLLPHQL